MVQLHEKIKKNVKENGGCNYNFLIVPKTPHNYEKRRKKQRGYDENLI